MIFIFDTVHSTGGEGGLQDFTNPHYLANSSSMDSKAGPHISDSVIKKPRMEGHQLIADQARSERI